MPYPAGHRSAVKKNIIDSARKLFNRHGFESVSLKQIMAGVGLTHGGFYSYFKSKIAVRGTKLRRKSSPVDLD
jgi:TetR/AcrR family transcriptional regulator, transcriptional repressor for nem operon